MADPSDASITVDKLLQRQAEIDTRLEEMSAIDVLPPAATIIAAVPSRSGRRSAKSTETTTTDKTIVATANTLIPYSPKSIDTHWDFVMKEMMWLGADFQGERKRQVSSAKKLASSVKQFHKSKEARRLRELHLAEMKRRKLAAKIGRDIRGWWSKIEKVISYKQKLMADEERQAAMNKQLVVLVQQTEKYTESLAHNIYSDDEDEDDDTSDGTETGESEMEDTTDDLVTSDSDTFTSGSEDGRRRRKRRKRRGFRLTIEEALASENTFVRKSKKKIIDYSRMRLPSDEFYGENTASDVSGSDGSYSPGDDGSENDSDDDSTLQQAMHEELKERQQDATSTFLADPEELRKLREEVTLNIDEVIERLRQEGEEEIAPMDVESFQPDTPTMANKSDSKHVHFSDTVQETLLSPRQPDITNPDEDDVSASKSTHIIALDPVGKYDADDDADASDVEDYNDSADQKSDEELDAQEPEADDESIIAQKGFVPRDASTAEELALLQQEGELPIEELRKIYSNRDEHIEQATEIGKARSKENHTEKAVQVLVASEDDNATEMAEDSDEFEPPAMAEVDDETTIEAEEKLGRDMSYEDEMSLLKRESEIPIEELRAMYTEAAEAKYDDQAKNEENIETYHPSEEEASLQYSSSTTPTTKIHADETMSEDEGTEEYEFIESEAIDDECTIEAEERLGRDMTYEEEIALLKQESEMSVEELKARYAKMEAENVEQPQQNETILLNLSGDDEDEAGEEFEPNDAEGVDDETTLEAEEVLGREMSYEEEMAILKRDSEIPIEELVAMYRRIQTQEESGQEDSEDENSKRSNANDPISLVGELLGQGFDDEEDFVPNEADAMDDETTIEAEEKLGHEISHEEEIALLKRESGMPVEELRKMYAKLYEENESGGNNNDVEEGDNDLSEKSTKRRREVKEVYEGAKKPKVEDAGDTADDGLAALNALEASAERAKRTLASRPFLLSGWVKLRLYQQVGLNWLVSLQSRRLNGILADEMGLGKTLQTISLLAYLASYKGIWGPHLIVVPTSVIINWETELKRFCPALKVLCYYGSAKRRKELRQGWTKTNWYHVVITSYQLAVQDAFAFKRKKWYYLVLDEAQNIKNFQSQRWQTLINFNTQRRLLLTGTPLQNNLMELWSLLHFLMPYIFRSRKEFSYWFSNPMTNMIEGTASRNDDVIKRLHGIIRPFVLRRLKKDVETQMPGKYEHIVKCQLSRRQMALYEEFLSRSSTRMALTKGGNFMGMMNVLMQLRKVCNHPDLFEPRSVVTPFIVPSLSFTVPSFVCTATSALPVMDRASLNLLQPLWCGSSGLPSIVGSLRHDKVESEELQRLRAEIPLSDSTLLEEGKMGCPDEVKDLVAQVHELRRKNAEENIRLRNDINRKRCEAPVFPYTDSLLRLAEVEYNIFQRTEPVELLGRKILLTPESLLSMRKNENDRSFDLEEIIDKFVFCVPPAGARAPILNAGNKASSVSILPTKNIDEMLQEPVEELLRPYRKAQARLSSFFPDKKLIQFDAGKLQTLAELLRNLKRGGHRALIFTQMSKMLDILEAFLNLNGHTYLRLDGSTGVDRRQRYMDRFNNDTKIFCFILSTRSGGMGVNLTGADTVIFYDSDWNPAMDAQAQDRAHRIGQTRDVHIYRLITEHTIEENILLKAKQKKNLDIMVMDQGRFDASHQINSAPGIEDSTSGEEMKDVYTNGGLRAILGVEDDNPVDHKQISNLDESKDTSGMSSEQMEMAMASLEDEDDVHALRDAQKEAAEEMKEFDENAEIKNESDPEDDDDGESGRPNKKPKKVKEEKPEEESKDNGNEESELEKEFAAWQSAVGFDAAAIESSLSQTERYGLLFREHIDPFYSIFYINELRRKSEMTENKEEIDIEQIEREKAMDEEQAMDDGDLLATRPRPESLIRQRNLYRREKARLRSDKKRRKLTGENWVQRVDGNTKILFWYNEDTGEAIWDTPAILLELQAEAEASQNGWGSLQIKILTSVMGFLIPYPERQCCSLVCKQWKSAANDFRFVRHVYPVEMGALSREPSRRDYNHFGSIEQALSTALPGDTIELSDGHYWVTETGLIFDKPLKLIGDEHNAANVVIEMRGSIIWTGHGGFVEGVTFRRPKMTSVELPSIPMLHISDKGRVDIVHSVLDNEGSTGSVVVASGTGRKGDWNNVTLRNGGCHGIQVSGEGVSITLQNSCVRGNKTSGIHCTNKATFGFSEGTIRNNGAFGMEIAAGGMGNVLKSRFIENEAGVMRRESGCNLTASMNVAVVTKPLGRGYPGFRIVSKGQEDAAIKEETKHEEFS